MRILLHFAQRRTCFAASRGPSENTIRTGALSISFHSLPSPEHTRRTCRHQTIRYRRSFRSVRRERRLALPAYAYTRFSLQQDVRALQKNRSQYESNGHARVRVLPIYDFLNSVIKLAGYIPTRFASRCCCSHTRPRRWPGIYYQDHRQSSSSYSTSASVGLASRSSESILI